MSMSPQSEAAAFIIWCDAQNHGWDRPISEIAGSVGMPTQRVTRVIALKGWLDRVRGASVDVRRRTQTLTDRFDEELDALGSRMSAEG